MEIRQLHYVIAIAKEKNFSRAAQKLHIAQPSLSQQLAKLERELNVQLVRRTTNFVELTHAGEVFVQKAQDILDRMEQLKQEIDDLSNMRKGKLIIGSLPMTGSHVLPLVLPVFAKQYPEIEITLVEDTSSRLEQLTLHGQTDLSLLSLPVHHQLNWEPIIEEEIYLAVPPHHLLATLNRRVDIRELELEPFIVLKKGQGFRQMMIELCEQHGFSPKIVFESSNIETVQSLVAAGMGIAFVPKMVTRAKWSEHAPVYVPLAHPVPSRMLVIASQSGRYISRAAKAFIETMKTTLAKHDDD